MIIINEYFLERIIIGTTFGKVAKFNEIDATSERAPGSS